MKLNWFRHKDLIVFFFFLITLGQGSPYLSLASQIFKDIGCKCCTIKHGGCPRCAKFGHDHPQQKKSKKLACEDHKDKKKDKKENETSLNPLACSTDTPFVLSQLILDPFLTENHFSFEFDNFYHQKLSTKNHALLAWFNSPEIEPPRLAIS